MALPNEVPRSRALGYPLAFTTMDLIGRTLNHYRVVAHLGQGGMGEVWVAEDAKLGRKVALKTLPARVAADPDRRARFEREARAIAALNHPNIVTIHSVEESEGIVFLTMERIEGRTLAEVIPARGLPLDRFFNLAVPLAGALAAAHQKGITHRDLKPANVMVTSDGRVKVLDFGLAKLAEPAPGESTATATAGITAEGKILGTAAFMSPEQAEGKPVDARSDVFSLGIVMYQMATGEQPFKGDTPISTITSILRDTPVSIGELKPAMPRHLGRVVARCLAKEPDRRYQTALDVRNELEGLRAEIDSGEIDATATSVSGIKRLPRAARSRRLVPVAAALVAAAVLVGAGVILWPKLRGGPSRAGAPDGTEKKSIAVLPFVNMSDDAKNDYFSDGLAEELLNVLAKVPGLKVAARTSSFHFKGATGNMADIGSQLGVETILEGSVRRAGKRVRITAELINAADGFQLWSETYDRELNDIFAIQEDIAGEVVAALKIKLLGPGGAAPTPARQATTNVEAHDAYLLGQQKMARRTSASLAEAAQSFQKAIDLDPDYALAYVGLSDATQRLGEYANLSSAEVLAKAEPLVGKALTLDDRLGEAYASLAGLETMKGNVPAAEANFRKAIELSPNYSMAYMWYGLLLRDRDPGKQLEMFRKALELDPLSPVVNVNIASALRAAGRPEEAVERCRRAIEIEPGLANAYALLSQIYADELNQPDEAVRYQRKAVEADPGNLGERVALAQRLEWVGHEEEAIAECRAILASHPDFSPAYAQLGNIYSRKGRLDEALRWQKEAVEKDPESWGLQIWLLLRYLNVGDETSARQMADRFTATHPGELIQRSFSFLLHSFRDEQDRAEKDARWLLDNNVFWARGLVWQFDMRAERFADARDLYRSSNPELFDGLRPRITSGNLGEAINIAAAELKLGDTARATTLLAACDAYIASRGGRTRRAFFRMEQVQIAALMGKKEQALAALRRAIDDGQREFWWGIPRSPNLDPIRDDPRFAAMMKEMRR